MGPVAGEGGLIPRLFLVAPERPAALLAACLEVACEAGDVASLLVSPSATKELVALAQSKNVAVLIAGDCAAATRLGCDGVHVNSSAEAVADARRAVGKNGIVGAFAGASRHLAMEAAEAGADYIALSQNGATIGGEPIVKWWSDFFEIPSVAFDPVEISALDILLPQNPDFIRPSDAMWDDAETSRRIISELMQRLATT